jgi:hypothetical protein
MVEVSLLYERNTLSNDVTEMHGFFLVKVVSFVTLCLLPSCLTPSQVSSGQVRELKIQRTNSGSALRLAHSQKCKVKT